jgi:asparagine synthase (glutamine-hydrolysing)
MNIDYKFFINGFWQQALGMSETAISYMGKNTDPYLLAKLASVEIWGSLFNLNQSIKEVEMRVKSYIKMNI